MVDLCDYALGHSEAARERFVDDLYDRFDQIAEFPGMGRSREELAQRMRSFAVNRHRVLIYYLYPEHEDGILYIARVLRQERDVGPDDFS